MNDWEKLNTERQGYQNTAGSGYPGFKLNQNQNNNSNYRKVEFGSKIPFFGSKQSSSNIKDERIKLPPPRKSDILIGMPGNILIRNADGFNNKLLGILVGIYDLTRLQTKLALETKIGLIGDVKAKDKSNNLNSKFDELNTNLTKFQKVKNVTSKIAKKVTAYDRKDFYHPLNFAAQFGVGGLGTTVAAGMGSYKLSTAASALTSTGALAGFLPLLIGALTIIAKGSGKYSKIQSKKMEDYGDNTKVKGNAFTDLISGKLFFDPNRRRDFKSNVVFERSIMQGIMDMRMTAGNAQLRSERELHLKRMNRELSKVGARYEMSKLVTTSADKLQTGLTTFEGRMLALSGGMYDSMRFMLLELTALRIGTVGTSKTSKSNSSNLLNFFEEISDELVQRTDRNVTNKTALIKNTAKSGIIGAIGALGSLPLIGFDPISAIAIGSPAVMAGYLGLKTLHSALRAPKFSDKGKRLGMIGAAGAIGLAGSKLVGLDPTGTLAGMSAVGLPGILAASLVTVLGAKAIKSGYNFVKTRSKEKFDKNELKIKEQERVSFQRKITSVTGLKYDTAKLLTTSSDSILSSLKNKDPMSQQISMLGGIFDVLRHIGLNIDVLRSGTVGDFKTGETVLDHFENSEESRKKREKQQNRGLFGWKDKLQTTKDSIKNNWKGAALGGIGGGSLAALLGAGLLTGGTAAVIGAGGILGIKKFNKIRKDKELQKHNEVKGILEGTLSRVSKFNKGSRESQPIANLAITSLPKIAERQLYYLAKIHEVEVNTYEVITKLYSALTGNTDLSYKSKNIKERTYVPELGEFLSDREYAAYKKLAFKNINIKDFNKYIKNLNPKLVNEFSSDIDEIKNKIVELNNDFGKTNKSKLANELNIKSRNRKLNIESPDVLLSSSNSSGILGLNNIVDSIKNLTNKVFMGLFENITTPYLKNIKPLFNKLGTLIDFLEKDSNQDNVLIENLQKTNDRSNVILTEIRELLRRNPNPPIPIRGNRGNPPAANDSDANNPPAANAAYSGGILTSHNYRRGTLVNFVPRGPDTVRASLPLGSGVIPREAVQRFPGIAKKLGQVVHAASGSIGLVPHGHVGAMVAPGEVIVPPRVVAANRGLVGGLVNAGRRIQRSRGLVGGGILDNKSIYDLLGPPKNERLKDSIDSKLKPNQLKTFALNILESPTFIAKSIEKGILSSKDFGKNEAVEQILLNMLPSLFGPASMILGPLVKLIRDISGLGYTAIKEPSNLSQKTAEVFSTKNLIAYGSSAIPIPGVGASINLAYDKLHDAGYLKRGGILDYGSSILDYGKSKLNSIKSAGSDLIELFKSGIGNKLPELISENLIKPIVSTLSTSLVNVIKDIPNNNFTKGITIAALGPASIFTELFFTMRDSINSYFKEYAKSGNISSAIGSSLRSVFSVTGSEFSGMFSTGTKYGAIGAAVATAIPVPGVNWVLGYLVGAAIGGLLGWMGDGRLNEISRVALRKLDEIVLEPANKFIDWFKDTFVSPIYDFIMKIKDWVDNKIGWLFKEKLPDITPDNKKSFFDRFKSESRYSGGVIGSRYFAEGVGRLGDNIDSEKDVSERKSLKDKETRDKFQLKVDIETRDLIKELVKETKSKKDIKTKIEDKKTNWVGILAAIAGGGVLITKFAPQIIEMLKPVFEGLGTIAKALFLDTKLGNYILAGLGVAFLGPALIRSVITPIVTSSLTFIGKNIGTVITKAGKFMFSKFGGIVTAAFEGISGFMEEYSKSGNIGKSLWEGLKQIFAVDAEGGVWSAIKGSMKYASYGATVGGMIGGLPGAIIGIGVGGVVGALLGWIGSDKLTKIGGELYQKLDDIVIQPFMSIYNWIREKLGLSVDKHTDVTSKFLEENGTKEKFDSLSDDKKKENEKLLRQEAIVQNVGILYNDYYEDPVKVVEGYINGDKGISPELLLKLGVTEEDLQKYNRQRLKNLLPKGIEADSSDFVDSATRTEESRMEVIKKYSIGTSSIFPDKYKTVSDVFKGYVNGEGDIPDKVLVEMGLSEKTIGTMREQAAENWMSRQNEASVGGWGRKSYEYKKEDFDKNQEKISKQAGLNYSGGILSNYYSEGLSPNIPDVAELHKSINEKVDPLIKKIRDAKSVKDAEKYYDELIQSQAFQSLGLETQNILTSMKDKLPTLSKENLKDFQEDLFGYYTASMGKLNKHLQQSPISSIPDFLKDVYNNPSDYSEHTGPMNVKKNFVKLANEHAGPYVDNKFRMDGSVPGEYVLSKYDKRESGYGSLLPDDAYSVVVIDGKAKSYRNKKGGELIPLILDEQLQKYVAKPEYKDPRDNLASLPPPKLASANYIGTSNIQYYKTGESNITSSDISTDSKSTIFNSETKLAKFLIDTFAQSKIGLTDATIEYLRTGNKDGISNQTLTEKSKTSGTLLDYLKNTNDINFKNEGNTVLNTFNKDTNVNKPLDTVNKSAPPAITKYQGSSLIIPNYFESGGLVGGEKHQPVTNKTSDTSGLNLVNVKTRSGKTASVASQYSKNFQEFINDFENSGYKIDTIGGYANRNAVGSSRKSYHAFGAAIDINPKANPYGKTLITDMPSNTGEVAKKYGLGWGGAWKSIKDAMHFSAAKSEGGSFDINRDGSGSKTSSADPSANTSNSGANSVATSGANTNTNNSDTSASSLPNIAGSVEAAFNSLSKLGIGGSPSTSVLGSNPSALTTTPQSPIGTTPPTTPGTDNNKSPVGTTQLPSGGFKEKSGAIVKNLMRDFGLSAVQAAGIVGNLGHESGGFKYSQEINPKSGRGGLGWAQWTGPRRKAFEAWCSKNNLDVKSDAANYGYLKYELQNSEKAAISAVKQASSLEDAVKLFENKFERAGVKNYESRNKYAKIALESSGSANASSPETASGSPNVATGKAEGGGTPSSLPNIAGDTNSAFGSLSKLGNGEISAFGATAKIRQPNIGGGTPSPANITSPANDVKEINESAFNLAQNPNQISESDKTSTTDTSSKTSPVSFPPIPMGGGVGADPQSSTAGMFTTIDPVCDRIVTALCSVSGQSILFGALTQATGQMPLPVVDGSRI